MFTTSQRHGELKVAGETSSRQLTDGDLLDAFIESRDPGSFELLLLRHAPMVFGVCRRVLGNRHDAEDAFQAAFLVLVRKAAMIQPRHMVASWLYGVAYRTSLQARATRDRKAKKVRLMEQLPDPVDDSKSDNDWLGLLDEELNRLPDTYRIPLILCELEGLSYRDAGAQMGLTEKAVSARLVRGRKMLAARLARHATVPTAAICSLSFSAETASAAVPASLVASTVQAAPLWAAGSVAVGVISPKVAALAQSVLKGMLLSKLQIGAIVLAVALFGMAANSAITWARSEAPPKPAPVAVAPPTSNPLNNFDGKWVVVSAERGGFPVAADEMRSLRYQLVISGSVAMLSDASDPEQRGLQGTLRPSITAGVGSVDMTFPLSDGRQATVYGICDRSADTLRLCYGSARPQEFHTQPGHDDQRLFVFQREEKRGK